MREGGANPLGAALRGRTDSGQSTVEYALVLFAFLASILALGALWGKAHAGGLMDLALEWASHLLDAASLDGARVLLLY